MANTLTVTDLAADIYAARDMVAREATGAINSVLVNAGSEAAGKGDTVRSFRTAQPTLNTSYTPAMAIPSADDQTVSNDTLILDQVANVRIPIVGEAFKSLDNGAGGELVRRDMIAQAIRTIVNAVESYLCGIIDTGASRAYGTAGTTPFGSNFNEIAQLRKILFDNGCPINDGLLSLVVNSTAGVNLRNQASLQKVGEAGSDVLLRKGELLNLQGFSLKESAGVVTHTAGTGASYQTNGTVSVGGTAIPVDTGTGTILAGDVFSVANDSTSSKYVVSSALSSGTVTIQRPGARAALGDNKALTISADHVSNFALHRNAVELAIRPVAKPPGGDAAVDSMVIADPVTGIAFTVSEYKGYGMNMLDFTCIYAAKVWKPEFLAKLLG